jgi:hypothetical protein
MKYAVEVASSGMIYVRAMFHEEWENIRAILRFYFRNFRGCNFGITEGRAL